MSQEFEMELEIGPVVPSSRYHSDDEHLQEPEAMMNDDRYIDERWSTSVNGAGLVRSALRKEDRDVLNLMSIDDAFTSLRNEDVEEDVPPENFSPVIGDIYRSSFPRQENFKFLGKLKIKTILVLIPEEYPPENMEFLKENNINLFQVGMSGNKEPFVKIPHDVLTRALEIAINPANHPLLIHCNRGKHRTGCLVGCIRRLQNWSLTMIMDEYRRFAAPKARPLDQQFIEMYNEDEIVQTATRNGWLPLRW